MAEYSPEAFAAVLTHPTQPTIIGGQAVNLWAEHYSDRAPELRPFRPFVSKDADLWADRKTVTALASSTGWECQYYDEPRTHAVALLTKKLKDSEGVLRIEVLKDVHGLSRDDLQKSAVLELPEGGTVRVLEPAPLLKGKISTLATFRASERPNDVKHVRLLIPILREDAIDRVAAVEAGTVTEREALAAFQYAAGIVCTPEAHRLAAAHTFDFKAIFPPALETSRLEKIRNFATEALPRLFVKSAAG